MLCDQQINLKRAERQKKKPERHRKKGRAVLSVVRRKSVVAGEADDGPDGVNQARDNAADICLDIRKRGISTGNVIPANFPYWPAKLAKNKSLLYALNSQESPKPFSKRMDRLGLADRSNRSWFGKP
jgi:hypothetical protein